MAKKAPPTSDDFLPGVFAQDDLDAIATDAAFPLVPHDLDTDYRCPSCSFEWSGVPKPAADTDIAAQAPQPRAVVTPPKMPPLPKMVPVPANPPRPSAPPAPARPTPSAPAPPTTRPHLPSRLEPPAGADKISPGPAEPDSVAVSPAPAAPVVAPEPIAMTSPDGVAFNAPGLKLALEQRGHRVMTQDGKLLISEASQLTDVDRIAIKALKPELLLLAEPWIDTPDVSAGVSRPSAHDAERATSGVSFSGAESPNIGLDYRPDEPPDLTGIDEIVLNFATDGLEWAQGARPVGVTVSTLDGRMTRFLPFAFKGGGNIDEAAIKRWAHEQLRNKKITNSKTKFDIHHAREWGVDLEAQGCTFSDIQHTAALLDDHRKRFALDVLAADYLPDVPVIARLDESQHADYHAADAAARERYTAQTVGRLVAVLYPEINKQELRAVQQLEDEVIPAVVEMEKNGSPIDMELLAQYGADCTAKRDALMWEINRECGFAFEHTAAGWKRLIESLHLTVPESFSEAVLNEVDHPLIRKGQRAAQYASLNSKIFKAYPEHIIDGVLRYNINQLASDDGGTVSGRFSIGVVQQVPNADNHTAAFGDELFPRRLFIAADGKPYLEADAAQIEFRLLVHYSESAKLLQAYRDDPEMSFHKKMQEMLVTYKPNMLYTHTKSYNFAAQYGAKSIKLAVMMGFITAREGDEIRNAKRWTDPRLKTIKDIEAAYKSAHPEAGALLDRAAHLAKSACDQYCKKGDALHRLYPHRGYVKTLLGRRSRFPTNFKTYIGLNRVLQGTGADIMKRKLVELHKARRDTGLVMRITNHDAVLGDATTPETLPKVHEILNTQSFDLKVPILWQCGTGKNWAEAK